MKFKLNTPKALLIQLLALVILTISGALFFFYAWLPTTTNHGETITVPNLEGISMEEIEDFLLKRNLRYEVNDSAYSDEYPPLTILKQYPKSGSKVKENRKIFISVNRINPPTVPVPELLDRSLRNAEAVLKSNELKRGPIKYKPSPFLNLVLEMYYNGEPVKEGERIPKGSVIDLVIGDGYARSRFPTPNVVGNEMEEARFLILGSSLNLGLITAVGDTTRGRIIVTKQAPEAGANIKIGDAVDIWVAPEGYEPEEEN